MKQNKKLVLLDAHAIIHRAYHALPDFTGPKGEPTGALYGLSSMLLRIISDLSPDYLVACYDLPKPTIRHEAYEGYKGTRTKTDDALIAQLKKSRAVFEAFSIPIYEREGFEADDIIGTVVEMTKDEKNLEVIIASGDMDTLQLIEGKRVRVYTLKKGLNETTLYDEEAVKTRYGFAPKLIPDYKGLRGDPSDNIKGVPGVGEKTATELIIHFGTVEEMYKTLAKSEQTFVEKGIKSRMVELLKNHKEDALFSKMLATIRRDAPISFRLPDVAYQDGARLPAILTLFDEFGFRSLRPRVKEVFWHESNSNSFDLSSPTEEIDPVLFKEAQVMLWLLVSDFTNPTLDDILAFSKKNTLKEAAEMLSASLALLPDLNSLYEDIEKPLIRVLEKMHTCGVRIDIKALETLKEVYQKELDTQEKNIHALAGHPFNINSPKQLGEVLFDELALLVKGQKKTAGGQRSTRESELEKIKDLHPIVSSVLEYREIQKLLSTYIDTIPRELDKEDRLHAHFLQTGTVTGRMSSQNPNLQNIPIRTERGRAIRNAFIAREGFTLVSLDYSQIELRLAAILSKDETLCEIFREGRDVHTEVASRVFSVPPNAVDKEMRRRAKIINFGILYGMGVNALKTELGSTLPEAHAFLEGYFNTFKRLVEYLEETKGYARKHGYTKTAFGRRRQFPDIKSPLPYVRAQAERMAINAPIQGTQSDIIKRAMVQVDMFLRSEREEENAHLLLQVHDELVYEIKKEKVGIILPQIKKHMEKPFKEGEEARVPLLVEAKIGDNWGAMTPFLL